MSRPLPPKGGGFGDAGARRHRLHDIHDVVSSLREPVEAPDLTGAILSRVEAEKPFVDDRTRRLVWVSRLGFAASLAVAALGVALMHRSAPQWLHLAPQAQPLSDVVATAGDEVTTGIRALRTTFAAAAPTARPVIDLPSAPAEPAPAGLAPLPPAYSTTFASLSQRPSGARSAVQPVGMWDAAGHTPGVRRVPLTLTPAPRIVIEAASAPAAEMPAAGIGAGGAWWATLSTAPMGRGTVIVVRPTPTAGAPPAAAPAWAPAVSHRAVLDRLGPPAGGPDDAEPAVPR